MNFEFYFSYILDLLKLFVIEFFKIENVILHLELLKSKIEKCINI